MKRFRAQTPALLRREIRVQFGDLFSIKQKGRAARGEQSSAHGWDCGRGMCSFGGVSPFLLGWTYLRAGRTMYPGKQPSLGDFPFSLLQTLRWFVASPDPAFSREPGMILPLQGPTVPIPPFPSLSLFFFPPATHFKQAVLCQRRPPPPNGEELWGWGLLGSFSPTDHANGDKLLGPNKPPAGGSTGFIIKFPGLANQGKGKLPGKPLVGSGA